MLRAVLRLLRFAVLALFGVAVVAKLVLESHASEDTEEIDLVNIIGSEHLNSSAQPFFGGKVTTVLGGTTLDLRRAIPAPTGVYLDVFALLGAVSIVLPPGWRLHFEGSVVGGEFDDLTHTVSDPDAPVVRVGGLVAFGGLRATTRQPLEAVS